MIIRFNQERQTTPGAVNMGYVALPGLGPDQAMTLRDLSYEIPNAISQAGGGFVAPLINTGDVVDWVATPTGNPALPTPTLYTDRVINSTRSVLHPNVHDPRPLFYKTELPSGIYVVSPDARDWAVNYNPYYLDELRTMIAKNIHFIREDGQSIPGTYFDIDLLSYNTTTSDGYALYDVDFYTNVQSENGNTYFFVFDAYDTNTSTYLPNYRLLVNAQEANEIPTVQVAGYPGWYAAAPSATAAPSLAIWAKSNTTTGNKLYFLGGQVYVYATAAVINMYEMTAYEVAAAIMEEDPTLRVTVLNDVYGIYNYDGILYYNTDVTLSTSDFSIWRPYVVSSDNHGSFRYKTERLKVWMNPHKAPYEPWHCMISNAKYRAESQDGWSTGGEYIYYPTEFTGQPSTTNPNVTIPTGIVWETVDEIPIQVSPKVYQTRNYPIVDGSISLRHRGVDLTLANVVEHIDYNNGKLFLNDPATDPSSISVTYAYELEGYVYKQLNLNPTEGHNPDIVGDYIGIFMLPHCLRHPGGGTYSITDRTVFHYIASSYTGVIAGVTNMTFPTGMGGYDVEPLLLGIFNVIRTADPEDTKIYDSRSRGGGVIGDLAGDYHEGSMFWDVGKWGGEPFQAAGSLIAEIPEITLNTGQVPAGTVSLPVQPTGFPNPSGLLTRDEQLDALNRDKPAGTLVILDYYTGPVNMNS